MLNHNAAIGSDSFYAALGLTFAEADVLFDTRQRHDIPDKQEALERIEFLFARYGEPLHVADGFNETTENSMRSHLNMVAEAILIIVSVVLLAIPEARTTPIRLAFAFFFVAVVLPELRRQYRAGMFSMTPTQIYKTVNERPSSFLSITAYLLGFFALSAAMP